MLNRLASGPRLDEIGKRLTATPVIPVLVAVVLGLYRIGEKSLWLDEAYSALAARLPMRNLIDLLIGRELNNAPHYLALKAWLVLGSDEATLRALSVVFGAVAVAATFYVGRRFAVAFPAALLLAISPTFIEYEQEARTYTLLMAMSAISTLLYLRMVDVRSPWRTGGYVAAGVAMIYIHPLGALVVVAHGLHALASAPARSRIRQLAPFAPIAIGWLPMVVYAYLRRDKYDGVASASLEDMVAPLVGVAGGTVLAGCLLIMLAYGFRRDLTAFWLVVPIVGTVLLALLVAPVVSDRYMLGVLPAAAVIAARNKRSVVALFICLSLVGVWNWYEHGTKADWRGAAAWVGAEVRPDDGVVFAPTYMRIPFSYYAQVGRPLHATVPWNGGVYANFGGGRTDVEQIQASPRIWLVEGHTRDLPPEVAAVLDEFRVVETRDYGSNSVRVTLLEGDGS